MTTGPLAEINTFCQIPVSRSRIAGIQSHPIVERNVGPSIAVVPPFCPTPSRIVCSCGTPGCGCGDTSTASTALLPAFTSCEISNVPRLKAPFIAPTCRPFTQTCAEKLIHSKFSHPCLPEYAFGTSKTVRYQYAARDKL